MAASWTTVAATKRHLDRARRLGLHENVSPAVFAAQHLEIFDAVVGGNVSLARTAMRAHLRAVFSDIERPRALTRTVRHRSLDGTGATQRRGLGVTA